MLDVRKLLMLRSIADEGSIAGAARSLKYTRSAVSQQLKAFERTAGVPLVSRGGNRITLTPAGQALVEHTERILVELRRRGDARERHRRRQWTASRRSSVPFRPAHHDSRPDPSTNRISVDGSASRGNDRRHRWRRGTPRAARHGDRVAVRRRSPEDSTRAARVDPQQ